MTLKLSRAWKHYGLRTCNADGTSYNGFVWPETGMVECPDWSPEPECGNGLHALLNGEGGSSHLDWTDGARWQLVGFDEYVDLGGKTKFPRCEVATGTREAVTSALKALTGAAVHGVITTAGYRGTASAGDGGIIQIKWWDGARYRIAVAYVGEDGIKPNTPYRVENGKFAEARS